MDYAVLGQLVGSLGFPIVCCGAMFWLMNQQNKTNQENNKQMTEAINNNTLAITKLVTKIGGE